jgi:uncharacterized membrane protein YdjX (TVP38/TMEM64 family)
LSVPERVGRVATYLWFLAATVALVIWIRDPSVFTQESMAEWMLGWGEWAFWGFVVVALGRGLFLVPSTPVVLAGGVLFPDIPLAVFVFSMAGIVLSATVIYLLPGMGGYDALLERKYPDKIARLKVHLVKPHAFWVVAGWSFFPFVPTDVICYVAGLVRMSYRRMILAMILGEAPLVLGYLLLTQRVHGLLE